MTGMLADRARAEREARVKAVVGKLAHKVPELADLDEATLEKVARIALLDEVKCKLRDAARLERIPYAEERELFIARASRTGSERTRKLYAGALARLEAWCERQGLSPLELTPARADDWIEAEKAEGRAPATVQLAISGASAFWTWMERRHPELRNPFRGTRARPAKKPARASTAPSIAKAFEYLARKVFQAGRIRARYSVHDLRHAFAVRLYESTHDVYQVEQALGHASVGVTETYLRSLPFGGLKPS
ncbi:MAG: site-specific integrase [Spirochaetes bacterium]|nr:site-specific integrase [Spirochaetota bacterium]